MRNQLGSEKSPYLKSAAHQPIHWLPWSEETFQKAQAEDKPILLDIGAVWCHWCHVMDRETYENLEVANLINEHFIPVKVDRDERPDVDSRYQMAVSAITGQGGWPLTAFLTPQGDVFYGGTYFPPDDKYGRPGFKSVLQRVAETYRQKKELVVKDAQKIRSFMEQGSSRLAAPRELSDSILQGVLESMQGTFDLTHGGFGDRPKFPHPSTLELVMNRYFFAREEWLLTVATKTLERMGKGGIYDQLAGGFHRYSVDERWVVPHFEKMSYDNSELLKNYLHAYQLTQEPFFKEIALGIISFVKTVASDQKRGGFYASQDADFGMEDDGDYFTWTKEEMEAALDPDEARVVRLHYDIEEEGEMHLNPSKNVLYVAREAEDVAKILALKVEEVEKTLASAKKKMLAERLKRPTPFVDPTLYTHWNAMMIQAYLEAYKVLGLAECRDFALKTLDFLLQHSFVKNGGTYHATHGQEAYIEGILDDQIQMTLALLDAYEITGEKKYLEKAEGLMNHTLKGFWDEKEGAFFDIAKPKESVVTLTVKQKVIQDNPTPSPNAVAAIALNRLYFLTDKKEYRESAESTLRFFSGQIENLGIFAATYAVALDFHLREPFKVVITGRETDSRLRELHETAVQVFRPYKIIQRFDPERVRDEPLNEALRAQLKQAKDSAEPLAFVCSGNVCQKPTSDPSQLKTYIETLLS